MLRLYLNELNLRLMFPMAIASCHEITLLIRLFFRGYSTTNRQILEILQGSILHSLDPSNG